MAVGTVTKMITCDGETIPAGIGATYTTAGSGVEKHVIGPTQPILFPAALAGNAAWGASSAAITLATGHGLTTANKVGVFWTVGGVNYYRINLTISAYDSGTITVTNSTGSGTALPTSSTAAVVVSPPVAIADISFAGSELNQLVINCDQIAVVDLLTGAGTSLVANGVSLPMANIPYVFIDSDPTGTRPFTGVVASAQCYNGSVTAATLEIKAITNS